MHQLAVSLLRSICLKRTPQVFDRERKSLSHDALRTKKGIGRFGPTAHADDIPQEVDAVSHLGATGSLLETSTERLKGTQRSTTKIRLAPQKKKSKVLTRLD